MKKLFYPAVLIATVLLGGILAYGIWKAAPRTSQSYFESGKKYYEEKKYPEATIQLLNAVRKDERNRDARYLLAQTFLRQQNLPQAAGQLKALLEFYPDDVVADLQLASIDLTAGRTNPDFFRQAQEIATKILKKDPQNVAALILSGNAFAGLQDYQSSVDVFEKALSLDPQNLAAVLSLGGSQALQKNYSEAEQAFLKARQIDPKSKMAVISLANYYRAARDPKKAEAAFKDALSMFPDDKEIYIPAVQFYMQEMRFDEVEKVLRAAQAKTADSPSPSLFLADFYAGNDRPQDARNLLLELKQKFPRDLEVAGKIALNFMQDQPDRARAEIDQILKAQPRNPTAQMLLGNLQFSAGQYDAAEATLQKDSVVDSPLPQVHFLLGNIAVRKSLLDQALFHYQKSLAVNSGFLPARVALAETFFYQGKISDAREEARKALEIQSNYVPARLLKVRLDDAEKKNTVGVEQELTELSKQEPGNVGVYRQMGRYYESRGQTADAEKNFVRALELLPDSPEILRDLMLFYLRSKQPDKAIQRINIIADAKKQAFHYELLGMVYGASGNSKEAEIAFKKALEKEPGRASSNAYLFSEYMKYGRPDDALKKLDDMIQKDPSNAGLITTRGSLYESRGNIEEAKKNYAQALQIDPTSEVAANNMAYLVAEGGGDLQVALGLAQTARKKQPESADFADTLGWIYYKLGNQVLARDQLKFAVSKQPGNAAFQYHLGMIYKANKQLSDADSALRKAVTSPKDSKEKQLAQAALKEIQK